MHAVCYCTPAAPAAGLLSKNIRALYNKKQKPSSKSEMFYYLDIGSIHGYLIVQSEAVEWNVHVCFDHLTYFVCNIL